MRRSIEEQAEFAKMVLEDRKMSNEQSEGHTHPSGDASKRRPLRIPDRHTAIAIATGQTITPKTRSSTSKSPS